MTRDRIAAVLTGALTLVAAVAAAEDAEPMAQALPEDETIIEVDPQPVDLAPQPVEADILLEDDRGPVGVTLQLGGGVQGFTDDNARDVGDVGGSWTARLVVGTKWPFAFEAAYIGNAQDINALGLDPDAVLVGNGLEGLLRINLLEGFLSDPVAQPYVAVGGGWRHYRVTNESFNTSNVSSSDDVFEVPLGAGIAFRTGAVFVDVRGNYRRAFEDNLITPAANGDEFDLHSWNAEATLGFEF